MGWPVLALALTAAVAKRRALLASRALVVPDFGCTIGTENSGSFAVALLFKGFQDLQCLLHISTISFCNQDVGHPLQSIQRRPWLAVVVSDVLLDIGEITCLAHVVLWWLHSATCDCNYNAAKPKRPIILAGA